MPMFKKGDRRKFQTKEWQTSPERQCCHCLEFHRSCLPGISTIYDNPSHVSPETKLDVVQIFNISNILGKKQKQSQCIYDNPSHVSPQTQLDVVQIFNISNILGKKNKNNHNTSMTIHHTSHLRLNRVLFKYKNKNRP